MSTTTKSGHFKNLPRVGTVVSLLDRTRPGASLHAIVTDRVKRNGKLRLAFLSGNGRINYAIVVPNGSKWAEDKSIRYRWAYNTLTIPAYPEEISGFNAVGTTTGRINTSRKVSDVHPITGSKLVAQA